MRLYELIERLPKDTEERVEKARKRFNVAVREILRQETGLRLNRPGRERAETITEEIVIVPIAVVPGMPQPLKDMEFSPEDAALLLLGQHRTELLKLREGLPGVYSLVLEMMAAKNALVADGPYLTSAETLLEWTGRLLKRLDEANPVKKVLAVDEDVLGAYWYSPREWGREPRSNIELYWGVIGLIAQMLGTPVDALTVVVLAHECAHAYTHLGTDIDGERWDSEAFSRSEVALKEGLAQYYTFRVCKRLEESMPEAIEAYGKLLLQQPDAYWTHCDWINCFTPEEVRLAVLELRRRDLRTLEKYELALGRASEAIGPAGSRGSLESRDRSSSL